MWTTVPNLCESWEEDWVLKLQPPFWNRHVTRQRAPQKARTGLKMTLARLIRSDLAGGKEQLKSTRWALHWEGVFQHQWITSSVSFVTGSNESILQYRSPLATMKRVFSVIRHWRQWIRSSVSLVTGTNLCCLHLYRMHIIKTGSHATIAGYVGQYLRAVWNQHCDLSRIRSARFGDTDWRRLGAKMAEYLKQLQAVW